MQYAFVPRRRTTDDICIISQLQDKYIAANKPLYLSFVDPEKAEESSLVGLKRALGLRSGLYVSSMICIYGYKKPHTRQRSVQRGVVGLKRCVSENCSTP